MYNNFSTITISQAVDILNKEEIIAYPTETIFSIGCDPNSKIAINRLLKLKKRSAKKGFILIAADYMQLRHYIDDTILTQKQKKIILDSWSRPITFVFPANKLTPKWLMGNFNSLAVRISNHPLVIRLCHEFGKPLVSTSANISGQPPCLTVQEIHYQFGNCFPIIYGKTSKRRNPSEIRDAITYKCFRYG